MQRYSSSIHSPIASIQSRAASMPLPTSFVPEAKRQTATLGMGCFWSPEALFGQLPGVIRTRTGYAGGSTEKPEYRRMGDHSETVQVDYDPGQISYEQILKVFWDNHNPVNINGYKGRQYLSLLLFHNREQELAIQKLISQRIENGHNEPDTEIAPYTAFYPAEERHQKYYLKRFPDAIDKLRQLYPGSHDLESSTIAARLNGLAKGYTSMERIKCELEHWPIGAAERKRLSELIGKIRW
ncbi:peptide-methionine (S)-S-oxide reductase MsrA [Fontibacillus sp. BL9]|uniref:peptide-methionine (S)-S-oxide reductase MsrA n=1 Tax=Fontibacillus sp. BL9 TaxID=3389971 RepID=UPI00397D74D1